MSTNHSPSTSGRANRPRCTDCGRLHYAGLAVAVGRFRPEGVLGYRIAEGPDETLYPTRESAIAAWCVQRQAADREGKS